MCPTDLLSLFLADDHACAHARDQAFCSGGVSTELAVVDERPTAMRLRAILLGLALCVGCGVPNDRLSAGRAVATEQSQFDTSEPDDHQRGTTTSDDRVGYVPVGARTGAQLPEEALAQTLAGLSGVIRSATLGPKPTDVDTADGVSVHVEVIVDGPSAVQQMEGDWEAALLVGAVADRTTADGHLASVIKAYLTDYVHADGTVTSGLWQPTNDSIVAGQHFQPPGDDRQIERTVADTLALYNMDLMSIEVLHPLDAAVKVVATINSSDAMNGRLAEVQTVLTGTPIQYEGLYLEVRLPDASPIAVLATSFRTGRGSQWVRPDLEDSLGGPAHG